MSVYHSVDATKETSRLGRLINHCKTGNCQTRLHPIDGTPHLILVASRDINAGEELLYDYGDRSKASILAHPWLKHWDLDFLFFFPLIYEFVPSAVQFLYGKRCDTWNVLFCIDASAGEVYFFYQDFISLWNVAVIFFEKQVCTVNGVSFSNCHSSFVNYYMCCKLRNKAVFIPAVTWLVVHSITK